MSHVIVRVYGPLNDFLPHAHRHVARVHSLDGRPSVKDLIESLGVPHPEIDLIDAALAEAERREQDVLL